MMCPRTVKIDQYHVLTLGFKEKKSLSPKELTIFLQGNFKNLINIIYANLF